MASVGRIGHVAHFSRPATLYLFTSPINQAYTHSTMDNITLIEIYGKLEIFMLWTAESLVNGQLTLSGIVSRPQP